VFSSARDSDCRPPSRMWCHCWQVVIPFSFKRQNSGVVTSLVYNIQSNSWSSGARPAIQLGRYAMVQGSLQ